MASYFNKKLFAVLLFIPISFNAMADDIYDGNGRYVGYTTNNGNNGFYTAPIPSVADVDVTGQRSLHYGVQAMQNRNNRGY